MGSPVTGKLVGGASLRHGEECKTIRVVPQTSGLWGRFQTPPSFLLMCFDVVLTNNVAGTSFELN